MEPITIDYLYDLMRAYVLHKQRRPTHVLIHPVNLRKLEEIERSKFGYTSINFMDKKKHWQSVRIISTLDIEENEIIFLS